MGHRLLLGVFFIALFCSPVHAEIHYTFPVQPSGSASFSRGGHRYPGIDIFCKKGAVFVSPVSGTVEDAQKEDIWDRNVNGPENKGGRWVSVAGDDGYRYYGSHLERIADGIYIGKRVKPGDVLGYIGNSGNSKGSPIHLHFGISRVSRPYSWKVRKGEIEPYFFLQCIRSNKCDPKKTLDGYANKGQ